MRCTAGLLNTVAVLAAAGGAWAAFSTIDKVSEQNDIAARALLAANRPWLMPTSLSLSRLEVPDTQGATQVSATFVLAYQNIGKGPAGSIRIKVELASTHDHAKLNAAARHACGEADKLGDAFISSTFPERPGSVPAPVTLPISDLIGTGGADALRSIHGERAAFGKASPLTGDEASTAVEVGAAGCMAYDVARGATGHSTFAVVLNRVPASGRPIEQTIDFAEDIAWDASSLVLDQVPTDGAD